MQMRYSRCHAISLMEHRRWGGLYRGLEKVGRIGWEGDDDKRSSNGVSASFRGLCSVHQATGLSPKKTMPAKLISVT